MNLLEQFQTIRESAEHGLASALHFEAEGAELEEKMQALDTDDGIESLAKYRLRLIGSDEKIFRDIRG